ncbi:Rab GTPase-activating protein MSB3 KNAG_0K02330 [Huiozyma naganishii CBS 8797]|uniref:Rab-GAP TBC domain-containing protein n=1 Tax=Huiozyma naganishii (strain ATCC MYA-139 / BCRC 22969 / CBS 8797 / KCTC 17520 / NBRC 10181 / NCYC 3082 / Yp74L-3) TaxID=1071383 RepID=J7SAZ4_HUIN7|nr:hypothetical protein KNAG_0K02330 [Kazachstania naganishii CBS 8797]CCK72596.1 hypothetical protein KNAG_0K02330 [Kazachstania naganishii CBS 8797]
MAPQSFTNRLAMIKSPSVPNFAGSDPRSKKVECDHISDPRLLSALTLELSDARNSAVLSNLQIGKDHLESRDNSSSNLSVLDLYNDNIDDDDVNLPGGKEGSSGSIGSEINLLGHELNLLSTTPEVDPDDADSDNHRDDEDDDGDDNSIDQNRPKETPHVNESSKVSGSREISLEDQYDEYGFKKQSNYADTEVYNRWSQEYSECCSRRRFKWRQLMQKHRISTDGSSVPLVFPPKNEKLKRYVRKGIPAEWRGTAWWYFAGGQETLDANIGVYDKLVKKVEKIQRGHKAEKYSKVLSDMEIIERDLNRTFPDNVHFQKNDTSSGEEPEMITSLRRILVGFSIYNPKIGYCQSMNFLAGLLLLFLREEKVFWMLVIITSRYLPGVHNVNLEGVNVDQGVLLLCVKEYIPELWAQIKPTCEQTVLSTRGKRPVKNEFLYRLPPITLCTASWFMSCFIGVVPIETTLRIWDCMFYEGSHFLFKISLGILKLSEHKLNMNKHRGRGSPLNKFYQHGDSSSGERVDRLYGEDESDIEMFQVIQSFPKSFIDVNDLFDRTIFKKRASFNNLDQEEIDRCRKYVQTQRNKYKEFVEHKDVRGGDSRQIGEQTRATSVSNAPKSKGVVPSTAPSSPSLRKQHGKSGTLRDDTDLRTVLGREDYGFKRSLTNGNWNNGLKQKMRQMRKKRDK